VPGLGTRATACERCAKDRICPQGDIEKRTDLLRCYLSRVENGHTVPTVETSEKMAGALELPMYELFYDGQAVKQDDAGSPDRMQRSNASSRAR
jgi:transcriptional regulator with XRE-family HTH domain